MKRIFLLIFLLFSVSASAYLTPLYSGGSGGAPSGPAGGDLAGTYPNPGFAEDRVRIAGDTMSGGLQAPSVQVTGITASRAIVTDASKNLTQSTVTSTELGYLSGTTASVQSQINAINPSSYVLKAGDTMTGPLGLNYAGFSPSGVVVSNASRGLNTSSTVDLTELGYLDGVTQALQTQINAKVNLSGDTMSGALGLTANSASNQLRLIRTGTNAGSALLGADSSGVIVQDSAGTQRFNLTTAGNVGIYFGTASDALLERTGSGALSTNATLALTGNTASRALVTDASKNLVSSSVTSTELGYVSGVTSAIQTQINALIASGGSYVLKAGDTMSGGLGTTGLRLPFSAAPSILYGNDTDTGPYQTGDGEYYINANGFQRFHVSQNYTEFLGSVTANSNVDVGGTLTANFLKGAFVGANRALASDGSGNVASTSVTDTELGYLSGATGNIQAQLDAPVDLTTNVIGILPANNGGTGVNGLPYNSVPYYSSSDQFADDNSSFNYDATQHRLNLADLFVNSNNDSTSKNIGAVGGNLTGVTAINSDVFRVQQNLDGTFGYIQGPSYLTNLNGVTTSTMIGRETSPNVGANSRIDLMKLDEIGPFLDSSASIGTFEGRTITPVLSGTIGEITLSKINPSVSSLGAVTGSVTGETINLNGITANALSGLNIDTTNNVTTGTDQRAKSITASGQGFNFITVAQPFGSAPASGNDAVNVAITQYTVDTAMPYADVIGLATPLALTVTGSGSVPTSGSGIGIASVGYANLLGIQTGVTVPDFGGAIAAVVNTFGGSGETGGHLGRFWGYKSLGILPGGGSNTFGDGIHFWAADGMCSQLSGNCYSLKSDDVNARLYQAGPLTLGLTASRVPYLDSTSTLVASSVTPTELGYVNGVTSAIQTQINTHSTAIAGLQGVTGNFVLKAGDTMTGALLVGVTGNALQIANPPTTLSGTNIITPNVIARSDSSFAGFASVSPTSNGIFEAIGYGNATNRFRGYRASGGDPTTPAAIAGTGGITQLEAFGYDGSSFQQGAGLNLRSTGTWSTSDHRSDVQLNNTLQGTTTLVTSFAVSDLGAVTLGPSGVTVTHPVNGGMSFTKTTTHGGGFATTRTDTASAATIDTLDCSTGFAKLTGSTATTLRGIVAPTVTNGFQCIIYNAMGANLTFSNENASATAANRITTMTGADILTVGNGAGQVIYDSAASRWILVNVEM